MTGVCLFLPFARSGPIPSRPGRQFVYITLYFVFKGMYYETFAKSVVGCTLKKQYFFQVNQNVLEDRPIFLQRIVMVKIYHFALQGILFSRVRVYPIGPDLNVLTYLSNLFHVGPELVVLHKTKTKKYGKYQHGKNAS